MWSRRTVVGGALLTCKPPRVLGGRTLRRSRPGPLDRKGRWWTNLREARALIREPSPAGHGESCLDSRLPKAGRGQLGVVIYGARLYLGDGLTCVDDFRQFNCRLVGMADP
ncbi:hypothetical protein Taro_018527 [Colocasia esculenta]|uniref:Uncharacterized protein n=1 Tax=Colocasia esculenta TaxID=4460 RepID=A0A843UR81_COLES|nr:hypothetical protein [Colocasia esculenta]